MLPRPRNLPAGFIPPCLPMKAPKPPSGALWLHEIKHDGFRVIARKDGTRVRLYSRPGNDLTDRFSLIVEALAGLRSRSCIIDGEAVACDERGIAAFDRIRYRRNDNCVFLYAFDLIELNGDDLRRDPLVVRKATLASVIAKAAVGIRFNEHMEFDDGEIVFYHACRLGLEGIVSKRKDSTYRSGRSPDWLKMKNPACDPSVLAGLALRHKLPTVTLFPDFARAGGLIAYGPNLLDTYRPLGPLVGKIFHGAKPADLPVERPSKFELVVNVKTAKEIGVTIPTSILLRADEVIE